MIQVRLTHEIYKWFINKKIRFAQKKKTNDITLAHEKRMEI